MQPTSPEIGVAAQPDTAVEAAMYGARKVPGAGMRWDKRIWENHWPWSETNQTASRLASLAEEHHHDRTTPLDNFTLRTGDEGRTDFRELVEDRLGFKLGSKGIPIPEDGWDRLSQFPSALPEEQQVKAVSERLAARIKAGGKVDPDDGLVVIQEGDINQAFRGHTRRTDRKNNPILLEDAQRKIEEKIQHIWQV